MLIGQHEHTLDPKKRLSLPSRFRKELGKTVILTNGLDRSIFLYPKKEWGQMLVRFGELSIGNPDTRSFSRFILAGAIETDIDPAGRILIPDFLKEFAGLKEKVILAGVQSRVEIWDAETWQNYRKKLLSDADNLAKKLGEVGMI